MIVAVHLQYNWLHLFRNFREICKCDNISFCIYYCLCTTRINTIRAYSQHFTYILHYCSSFYVFLTLKSYVYSMKPIATGKRGIKLPHCVLSGQIIKQFIESYFIRRHFYAIPITIIRKEILDSKQFKSHTVFNRFSISHDTVEYSSLCSSCSKRLFPMRLSHTCKMGINLNLSLNLCVRSSLTGQSTYSFIRRENLLASS